MVSTIHIPALCKHMPCCSAIWGPVRYGVLDAQVYDKAARGIHPSDWAGLKGKVDGIWTTERWLDIRSPRVRTLMAKRMDYARSIGCDGIEPDNTQAWLEDTGFPLTRAHSVRTL